MQCALRFGIRRFHPRMPETGKDARVGAKETADAIGGPPIGARIHCEGTSSIPYFLEKAATIKNRSKNDDWMHQI